jgi:hypothetical protein
MEMKRVRAVLATQHLRKALGDKNVCRWIATHTVSTNRNKTRRRRFLPPIDIAANGGCAGARFPLSTNSLRIGPTSVERENTIAKPVRIYSPGRTPVLRLLALPARRRSKPDARLRRRAEYPAL